MTENGQVDLQRLIGEVAARHGILLKPDDAAFALVTINQLILEDVVANLLQQVRGITAEFEEAAGRVQVKAGGLIARDVKEATTAIRGELANDIAAAGKQAQELVLSVHRAHSRSAARRWLALGAACALILFVFGVFVGRLLK